ncbi:NAD(P)-binding domain-containing protein [Bacteriovorax sp. Seq25_V]|uniref:NAD(P)-binding domain-containing protein n=1 Tax=Bacteriovorax sp. Seq25_V TaxID=1201288 RepID=UPI00038A3414|nr:NAD(P)-binding domain-containing protein [Bacteriovorax sp. Seq25_V]EQC43886.1 pyridine nucleotide-disulfide oxidoreductase [Bacteriovorax sp. Seq25_V]
MIHEVAIIGAGPSGISLAQALKEKCISSIILEMGECGNSWANMPDHLGTITFWKSNCLRPKDLTMNKQNKISKASEIVQYLQYMAKGLDIRFSTKVESITKRESHYIVMTSSGEIEAKRVVLATGYFYNPFIPDFKKENVSLKEIHFAEYKNRASVGEAKNILVVGKGLSAGQIIEELCPHEDLDISISTRGDIKFGANDFLSKMTLFLLPLFDLLYGLVSNKKMIVPMGYGAKKYVKNRFPNIAKISEKRVFFSNGDSRDFDLIIYCTGFRSVASKILGEDKIINFESQKNEGVFYLGLEGLRNFKSRFLRGIREDAIALASIIEKKVKGEVR